MGNRYFKKEDGFFVLRRESIVDTIVTKEIHLGINDSIENYEVVSEDEGLELIRQRDEAMEAEMREMISGCISDKN